MNDGFIPNFIAQKDRGTDRGNWSRGYDGGKEGSVYMLSIIGFVSIDSVGPLWGKFNMFSLCVDRDFHFKS